MQLTARSHSRPSFFCSSTPGTTYCGCSLAIVCCSVCCIDDVVVVCRNRGESNQHRSSTTVQATTTRPESSVMAAVVEQTLRDSRHRAPSNRTGFHELFSIRLVGHTLSLKWLSYKRKDGQDADQSNWNSSHANSALLCFDFRQWLWTEHKQHTNRSTRVLLTTNNGCCRG